MPRRITQPTKLMDWKMETNWSKHSEKRMGLQMAMPICFSTGRRSEKRWANETGMAIRSCSNSETLMDYLKETGSQ